MSKGYGVTDNVITSSTSFKEMHHDLQNMLNVDTSHYDMNLEFQFKEHSTTLILPVKVTFEVQMKFLIELNKDGTMTLI